MQHENRLSELELIEEDMQLLLALQDALSNADAHPGGGPLCVLIDRIYSDLKRLKHLLVAEC